MNWNLENLKVEGVYLDTFKVSGRVTLSRVRYGGTVSHHVQLDEPIDVFGAEREVVILEHKYVTRVYTN